MIINCYACNTINVDMCLSDCTIYEDEYFPINVIREMANQKEKTV